MMTSFPRTAPPSSPFLQALRQRAGACRTALPSAERYRFPVLPDLQHVQVSAEHNQIGAPAGRKARTEKTGRESAPGHTPPRPVEGRGEHPDAHDVVPESIQRLGASFLKR